MANFSHQTGKPLPGVSPPAMQDGRHAARSILETLAGGKPMPFHYWDKGTMATIGRNKAVADLNFVHFGGFSRGSCGRGSTFFISWVSAIVFVVMAEWAWNYFSVLPRLTADHRHAGRPGRVAPPAAGVRADGVARRGAGAAGGVQAVGSHVVRSPWAARLGRGTPPPARVRHRAARPRVLRSSGARPPERTHAGVHRGAGDDVRFDRRRGG